MDRGAWGATIHGVARVGHDSATSERAGQKRWEVSRDVWKQCKNTDESMDSEDKVAVDKMGMWAQQARKSLTGQGAWISILRTINTSHPRPQPNSFIQKSDH